MLSADPESRPGLLGRAEAEQIARNLRAMADPTRIQILSLIVEADGGRRPVTELADELGLTQPTVSHHLRIMTDEGLLDRVQEGRTVWYSVVPSRVNEVFDSVHADPVAAVVAPPVLDRIAVDLSTRFAGVFSPETVAEYVPDPADLSMDGVRAVRDDIDSRVRALLAEMQFMNAA